MIISGGSDGLIAVSSPTTGMTVRVISDHKGAPISNIDVTNTQVRYKTCPLSRYSCIHNILCIVLQSCINLQSIHTLDISSG